MNRKLFTEFAEMGRNYKRGLGKMNKEEQISEIAEIINAKYKEWLDL